MLRPPVTLEREPSFIITATTTTIIVSLSFIYLFLSCYMSHKLSSNTLTPAPPLYPSRRYGNNKGAPGTH